ncbi:hypothetical protein Acr_19g0006050 [Actinidia rufa]|uniref:Prolamin-like domain-containing protein n=1 Tax=Actinidia rufa TaxID=165716 RepID=A0A7J0GAE6_9ERIC|nr:hypothetical protein Acr_19g0006050 [Actinidia rufa]
MASLTKLSLLVAMLVSLIAITVGAKGPEYFRRCKEKVGKECGTMIMNEMFFHNATTTGVCCHKLMTMGKKCHVRLMMKLLTMSPFKDKKGLVLERSKKILKKCSAMEKSGVGKEQEDTEEVFRDGDIKLTCAYASTVMKS